MSRRERIYKDYKFDINSTQIFIVNLLHVHRHFTRDMSIYSIYTFLSMFWKFSRGNYPVEEKESKVKLPKYS
jgi:hypothetical protein